MPAFWDCDWVTCHKSASTARSCDLSAFSAFQLGLTIKISTDLSIANCLSVVKLDFSDLSCLCDEVLYLFCYFVSMNSNCTMHPANTLTFDISDVEKGIVRTPQRSSEASIDTTSRAKTLALKEPDRHDSTYYQVGKGVTNAKPTAAEMEREIVETKTIPCTLNRRLFYCLHN